MKPTGVPVKEDQEEELSRRVWERSRQGLFVIIQESDDCKGFCEYELLEIRCFFVIVDFLGLVAPWWFFSLGSKSFYFVTKYLCHLIYCFTYLVICSVMVGLESFMIFTICEYSFSLGSKSMTAKPSLVTCSYYFSMVLP